jgi:DNA-binding CsgD family transcriptional regulator
MGAYSTKDMRGGAVARVESSDRIDDLLGEVVRQVRAATNEVQLPPHEAAVILDAEIEGIRCILIRPPVDAHRSHLSPREREIGRMVAKGYANKTIASVLDISAWTVGTHLRRIFAKLGVSTRAAMVAQLASEGFLNDDD